MVAELQLGDKKGPELLNNSLNQINKTVKRWDQRLTVHNLALAKRYFKRELRIHVPAPTGLGLYAEDFCAIFQWKLAISGLKSYWHRWNALAGEKLAQAPAQVDYNIPVRASHRYEEPVLIDDVELVELPERVVPSFVRA